jgi:hypothetical protein
VPFDVAPFVPENAEHHAVARRAVASCLMMANDSIAVRPDPRNRLL